MENYNESCVARIALTGGPKAGKTSVKKSIKRTFEELGYKVLIVGETATETIEAGFIPPQRPETDDIEEWRNYFEGNIDFQMIIMGLQISKETQWYEAAKKMGGKVLIIYDRAVPDNDGYLNKLLKDIEKYKEVYQIDGTVDLYKDLLSRFGLTPGEMMEWYEGIICLGTSVKYMDFKTQPITDTTQRLEADAMEALEVDWYVSKGYESHPNYIRIEATEKFEDKEMQIIEAVKSILESKQVRKLKK